MKIVIYESNSTNNRRSPQDKPINTMRRFILIVLLGVCYQIANVSGQDIHFSQFYMSPLNLNPAMTGVINCDQRFVVNYRNQWAGVLGANAYNTFSASYDRKMAVGRDDFFGVGGSLWGDVAGSTKFGTRQARLSFAYSKKMGGRRKVSHYLSVGADAGITQRRVDQTDLRWPTQVSNGQFDPTQGSNEAIPNADFLFADFSGGLMWFSNLGDRKSLYGGASLHHLNQANVSFLGRQESLFSRLTVYAGGEYPLNKKVSIKPDIIYMSQGPHKEYNFGAAARFSVGPNARGVNQPAGQFFQAGLWFRAGNSVESSLHSDAIIFTTRFEFDRYNIGLSYDYNVSQLSAAAAANGSFELSLVYLICGSGSSQVYCPVF